MRHLPSSIAALIANVFCATGRGGGIDPSCGRGGKRGYASVRSQVDRLLANPTAANLAGMTRALSTLKPGELRRLKSETGLRAGGPRAAVVAKLAKQITSSVTSAERHAREARSLGHSTAALKHYAGEFRRNHNEHADRVNSLIREVGKRYYGLTGKRLTRSNKVFDTGDPTKLKGWDKLARELAGDRHYSDLLHDAGYRGSGRAKEGMAAQTLFDVFKGGKVPRMTHREAHDKAIGMLRDTPATRQRRQRPATTDESFDLF